jgi:hypothetical protein
MEKKQGLNLENRLIDFRKESLKRLNTTTMRSHGKLWGMDVFSWFLPDPELMTNTLTAFPFQVIWLANEVDIVRTISDDERVIKNLHAVICIDNSIFSLPENLLGETKHVIGLNDLNSALECIQMMQGAQRVLLFTSSSNDWEEDKLKFENYLSMVQIK